MVVAVGGRNYYPQPGSKVCLSVDRHNFGLCIDTFNLAGRVYADPASSAGKTPNAERDIAESLQRLVSHVDIRKNFLVQMGDATCLREPLVPGHFLYDEDKPARMSWSRHCRLFYGEHSLGGYLPVKEIMMAVLVGLGYRGWVSYEIFNHRLGLSDASIPDEMASRASLSFERMLVDVFQGLMEALRNKYSSAMEQQSRL